MALAFENSQRLRPTSHRSWWQRVVRMLLWLVAVIALLIVALLTASYFNALSPAKPVGFQVVVVSDDAQQPLQIGIWYPTSATPSARWMGTGFMQVASNGAVAPNRHPLIVLSHGTGGGIASHVDLALALAAAGNIVVAPMHADNYLEPSRVGGPAYIYGRVRQLRTAVDYMLSSWPDKAQINATEIGAYGFSIGGFSVLAALGAQPDLTSVASYCLQHVEFACDMLKQAHSFLLDDAFPATAGEFAQDSRIQAAVIVAPDLGFTLRDPVSLSKIKSPIQLWQGEQDTTVPYASNGHWLATGLTSPVEVRQVPHAEHLSFLAPCGLLALLPTCQDPPGLDRSQMHQQMNTHVVDFFAKNLRN